MMCYFRNFLSEMEKRMHREGEAHKRAGAGVDMPAAPDGGAASMEGLSIAASNGSRPTIGALGAGPGSPTRGAPKTGGGFAAANAPRTAASPSKPASSSSPLKQKAASLLKR